jgi:hypothetical protein
LAIKTEGPAWPRGYTLSNSFLGLWSQRSGFSLLFQLVHNNVRSIRDLASAWGPTSGKAQQSLLESKTSSFPCLYIRNRHSIRGTADSYTKNTHQNFFFPFSLFLYVLLFYFDGIVKDGSRLNPCSSWREIEAGFFRQLWDLSGLISV